MERRPEDRIESHSVPGALVPYLVALGAGTVYGVGMRLITGAHFVLPRDNGSQLLFGVMTLTFLGIVPGVMGGLAIRPLLKPSITAAILLGWLPCITSVAVSYAIGAEGSICIVMGLPIMLFFSSIGGLAMRKIPKPYKNKATLSALALPFVCGAIENQLSVPDSLRTARSEIVIAAPPDVVWEHIERVATIDPSELRPSLASRLGFPLPVEATLDREGVGGVRRATFAGGVLFLETITEWDEPRRLSFAIDPQTETIPPETLDEHVTIGGRYFDVLQGTYEIEPRAEGCVLHLESRLRVSTTFNLYAGPWADALMQSIQEQILEVIRARCEKTVTKR